MPVEFLTAEQEAKYGQFTDEPTSEQLAKYFLLDDYDKFFIFRHKGDHNHLGIALQLCTVRFLGTFLSNPTLVPNSVLNYISCQLKIDKEKLDRYQKTESRWDHTREICNIYGYYDFNAQPQHWKLIRWLYTRAWLGSERPIILFNIATSKCVEQRMLLPGVTTLARLIAQISERASLHFFKKIASIPNPSELEKLNELLKSDIKTHQTKLDNLRHPPTTISSNGMIKALLRLQEIRSLGANNWAISGIPLGKIRKLAHYIAVARAQTINRMPENKRNAYLVAFAIIFTSTAQDDVINIFDKLLSELFKRTNSKGDKNKLRSSKTLSSSIRKILKAFEVLLDDNTLDENVRTTIFSQVPKDELTKAFHKVDSLTKSLEQKISFNELFQNYSNVRKFIPKLLEMVEFQTSLSGKTAIEAWLFLKKQEGRKHKKYYKNPPLAGISSDWKEVTVKNNTNTVYACGYTFWGFELMQKAIKNHDVIGSEIYNDPSAQLLQGESWASVKSQVIATSRWSTCAVDSINSLEKELDEAFKYTTSRLSENQFVRFETFSEKERIVLTPLERRDETSSYKLLHNRIQSLLPTTDLPILVLEINKWTNFLKCFTHISGRNSRVSDLDISLCAVLVAKACNIGFEPVVQSGIAALEYDRLTWVEQNYFRKETLDLARANLVEFHSKLPLTQKWGQGDVSSADGMRVIVPVKSSNSGYNSKYFGAKKGITYYDYISDQFSEINATLISGTIKDSLYLLQCVLGQQTVLQPKEIMTDTAGYSDIIFGLFGLLEYQFSPRLANIGDSTFWRIDKSADYEQLNNLSRNKINTNIINDNWDDILRVMGSLKLGSVNPTNLIQMLQRGGKPTMLGRAIREVGRIYKTLYLLVYIDDETYRRKILTQLNKGEGRHSLIRAISYGKRGELHQPYREGQEEQLGALGLLVNSIVLWNTRYMTAAIDTLSELGMAVDDEDVIHLSPLGYEHINIVGRYSFYLPKEIERGQLRPLKSLNKN